MALQPYLRPTSVGLCEECAAKRDEWYRHPADIAAGLLVTDDAEKQAFFVLMLHHLTLHYFDLEDDAAVLLPGLVSLLTNRTLVPKGHSPMDLGAYARSVLRQMDQDIDVGMSLIHGLDEESPATRRQCVTGIRLLEETRGIDRLIELLSDRDAGVRDEALAALKKLTGKSSLLGKRDPKKWKRMTAAVERKRAKI